MRTGILAARLICLRERSGISDNVVYGNLDRLKFSLVEVFVHSCSIPKYAAVSWVAINENNKKWLAP